MEVFQYKDEWSFHRHRFQCFAHLANHALWRGPQGFFLKGLSLVGFHQRRKLNYPGGCPLNQSLNHGTAFGFAHQLTNSLKHRVVGFFSAETFYTLPPSYTHVRAEGGPSMKEVCECGLANTRLAGNKNYLSLTLQCLAEKAI